MRKLTLKFWMLTLVMGSLLFTTGCKDDPAPVNPEELITTVKLTLTDVGTLTEYVFVWRDLDGDGGLPPSISIPASLPANTTFAGVIEFLNELETLVKDITEEVIDEGDEHQVFYQVTPALFPMTIIYSPLDELDVNDKNIGIKSVVVTGDAQAGGSLRIVLKHEPSKSPQRAIDNPDGAGGETDVDIVFTGINIVL
jgi:hypothetical protein